VEAILKAHVPRNKKQVRQILGKVNYIGKFIPHLAQITRPMTMLTSQSEDVKFVWGEAQQAAFEQLKEIIAKDVMLIYPRSDKPLNITTDASDYALGGVLSQTDDATGLERPIMFISKSLTDTERRYTVTEKELYSIVYALKKFKPYIYGRQFHVYTDHRALIWLCGKKDPMSRLGRWSLTIAEYAQGIHFVAGKQNRVADALSRAPFVEEPTQPSFEEYQSNPCIPQNIKDQVSSMVGIDPEDLKEKPDYWEIIRDRAVPTTGLNWEYQPMRTIMGQSVAKTISEIEGGPQSILATMSQSISWTPTLLPEYWSEKTETSEIPPEVNKDPDGILRVKGTDFYGRECQLLWIPVPFRKDVMKSYHSTPMTAHPSYRKMYLRMKQQVYWRGMERDVRKYVSHCGWCQKNRFGLQEKPQMQSRGPPLRPMQRISMDILTLEGVKAGGPANVLVVIDEFTRYAETYILNNMEAETVADKLVEEFVCRYGLPEELLTDRGSQFLSHLFLELCRQLRIQKLNTTAYHPECNGANERMHGTLYTILRALTNKGGKDWKRQLPMAMFVYRNTVHRSLGISPHQALFGYTSRHEYIDDSMFETSFPVDERVKALYDMREFLQAKMEKMEKENNLRRNRYRKLRCYEVGDKVMLRNHVRTKLDTPWRGPYTIVNKIGNVNYEIQLPVGDRTHKVIHVQHLKPWRQATEEDGMETIDEESEEEMGRSRPQREERRSDWIAWNVPAKQRKQIKEAAEQKRIKEPPIELETNRRITRQYAKSRNIKIP
jgi:transposase InsO family protein/ribosomal protein L21E